MYFILLSIISSLTNLKSTYKEDIYSFVLDDSIHYHGKYVYLSSPQFYIFNEPGAPAIPYYSFLIPAKGKLAELKVLDIKHKKITGRPLPLPSYDKNGMVTGYFENSNYPESFIPTNTITIETLNIRGYSFFRINIYPLAYSGNTLDLSTRITFSLVYSRTVKTESKNFLFSNIIGKPYYKFSHLKDYKFSSVFDSAIVWFKIPIQRSGAYKIDYSTLREKGLYATFSVNEIALYSRGPDTFKTKLSDSDFYVSEIPLVVKDENNNGVFDTGDYIIFYAEGPFTWIKSDTTYESFHNPYCDTTFYWLGFGTSGTYLHELEFHNAPIIDSILAFFHYEKDITNIAWKGLLWEGESIVRFQGNSQGERAFSFNLSNVMSQNGILRVRLVGGEAIKRTVIIESSSVNDTFSPTGYFIIKRTLSPFNVQNGTNSFSVKIQKIEGQDDSYGDQIYLDYYDVIYRTTINDDENREVFIDGNGNFTFSIGTRNAVVFNITNPLFPYLLPTEMNGDSYLAYDTTTTLSRYYIARDFNTPEVFLEPEAGKLYREDLSSTDMLIITSRTLEPALWKYKVYRELNFPVLRDSLWEKGTGRITIATVEDIYRDFGYGMHDPVAIRNFIYHVYTSSFYNGSPRLKFLLMVGDGTYDYRGIETKEGNIVPPFEPFETADINVYAEANETFYSDMTDDNFPDIFYGRVTARTESDVASYFNKIMAYEQQNTASLYRQRILLVADDERGPYGGDSEASWHVPQAEALYTTYTPKNAEKIVVYETDYGSAQNPEERGRLAKTALVNALNRGALIMGFYGHSNPVQMTHEMLFTINDVNLINTGGKPPLCVILTCKFGAFARVEPPRIIAEDWVLNPKGVLGVIASPNATFAFSNGTTGRNIFGFSLDGKIHPLGEVSLSGRDPSYFLLGDPATFFYYPSNDTTVEFANQRDTLYTGELSSASLAGAYSGKLLTLIIGSPKVKTYYTYPNNYVLRYHESTPTLFRGTLQKEEDTAHFKFYLPLSADTGLIYLNALRTYDGILKESSGEYLLRHGSITGDIDGPDISLTIANKTIKPGDVVNTPLSFKLNAILKDTHGINLEGVGGEKGIYLILNNTTYDLTPYFRYRENSYTEGELSYTISLENEGEYDASLVAYDNAQNRSQLTFKIYAEEGSQKISNVLIYPNPLRGEEGVYITFEIEKEARVQVSIYSISGTLIYRTSESFYPAGFNSIYWDGKDMFGKMPASGLYIVVININTDGKKSRIRKGLFIERR